MTDAELVRGLQANEDSAYREVVACYGDALYGYIYNILGDQHLSEDVLSETYLRMVEKIDSYTYYGAPFKAWLYRIAHNAAITSIRRARNVVGAAALDSLVARDDPAATVASHLQTEELRNAILELTEEQQQVVLLRFVGGQSSGEVAQALQKNENAIKQLQFRALRSLGRLLGRGE